jgi:hypothetical protein
MVPVPISQAMYAMGGSGGTGKCSHNYVTKLEIDNKICI